MPTPWLPLFSLLLFIIAYLSIFLNLRNQILIIPACALVLVPAGVLKIAQVGKAIDWNVIGVVLGVGTMVLALEETGVLDHLTSSFSRHARRPWRLLALFLGFTAVSSALLDNVGTILFLTPLAIGLAGSLEMDPTPFLVGEIVASNLGGTATLIGDPPNLAIGAGTGLSFLDFLGGAAPAVVLALLVTGVYLHWRYFREHRPSPRIIVALEEHVQALILPRKAWGTLVILALVLVGFVLAPFFALPIGAIGMAGATLTLAFNRTAPRRLWQHTNWELPVVLAGLFVLSAGLVHSGAVSSIGPYLDWIGRIGPYAPIAVLWLSGLISSVTNNLPYVVAMIPLLKDLVPGGSPAPSLWWALVLGSGFGAAGTLAGASANLAAAAVSARYNHRLTFRTYLRDGLPLALLSLATATLYLWLPLYLREAAWNVPAKRRPQRKKGGDNPLFCVPPIHPTWPWRIPPTWFHGSP